MQNAAKVGLLVVIAASLFAGAYFVLGRGLFRTPTQTFYARFPDAKGMTPGATVLLSGVPVGSVSAVALDPAGGAKLTLAIDEKVALPQGTVAQIEGSLIGIGDRQLLLVPGPGGQSMAAGSTLPGEVLSPLASFLPDSEATMAELQATLRATRELLSDADLKGNVNALLKSGEETSRQFGLLAARIDRLVAGNEARLSEALAKGNRILANVDALLIDARRQAGDLNLKQKLDRLTNELEATLKAGNKLVADMNAFVTDPQLREPLQQVMANTKTMSDSGVKIAANAEEISKNGITLSEKAIELTEKASALADDVAELLQSFKESIERLPKGAGGKLQVEGSLFRETEPNRWRTDVDVSFPYDGRTVHVGLYDALETNRVNLQMESRLRPNLAARYGVYASKAGAGLDLDVSPRLRLRTDLYNPNDPRFDVRLRYAPTGSIIGWAGVDDVGGRNAPTLGVGIRR